MFKDMIDLFWGSILRYFGIYNVKYYGAKGDGVADDTDAINQAIQAANSWIDASSRGLRSSPLSMLYRGGIVYCPRGIYNVRTIYMKSGVIIRGDGVLATRFNPIGTSGYVFDRDTTENWLSQFGLEDFTIAPTDEHFAFTPPYPTPPPVGGVNFRLTSQAYVNRINILNIGGIGIHMAECYDSFFSQMELIYVGADTTKPAIGMYPGMALPDGRDPSIIDVTNAIHMSKVRIENCPRGIELDGTKYVNKMLRELQFLEFKIENAPVVIKHIFGATFSNSHITAPIDVSVPAVTVGDVPPTDTRGVEFVDCTYFSGTANTRWIFNIVGPSTYDFKVKGGAVINIQKFLAVNAGSAANGDTVLPITIADLSAVNCGTPFIQAKRKLRLRGCTFFRMLGKDYAVAAGNSSRIIDCDFNNMDRAISMNTNNIVRETTFTTIATHAIYQTSPNNVFERVMFESGVAKPYEFANPAFALQTYKGTFQTSPAPGGYNQNHILTPVGTNDTYPAPTVALNRWSYFTNPSIKLIGTLETEIVTYKVEAVYEDGTTASIEKTYSGGAVNDWLTTEEIAPLITSRLPIVNFNLYAKSNTTNPISIASCRIWIIANIH